MIHVKTAALLSAALALAVTACSPIYASGAWGVRTAADASTTTTMRSDDGVSRPAGWTDASHGDDAEPSYEVVFPRDKVNQITIAIAPDDWQAMQANMTELFGERGARRQGGQGPGGPRLPRDENGQPQSPAPPDGAAPGQPPAPPNGLGPGGPGGDFTAENPMWVAATIEFNGKTWTSVGVRYKGNSSLRGAWDSGSLKLPFKLDFDEFEDENPEIKNQRFYGFNELSLGNNFSDASYMRDTITYDLLDEAGLVAAETAFYEVIVDYGEGPVSLGLYTAVEVIDDTVVKRSFEDDSGNIYEGDGRAASLASGTFELIEDSFQKESNKNTSDWSDVEALYQVLHSSERTTDPAAWRSALESVFEVDGFLHWLAVSSIIQHWDTYGAMTHNYYLYHDPSTDRLTWISWDHNMVLGGAGRGMGGRGSGALDKSDVGANWPLIRFLLDDPTYYAAYVGHLEKTADELFIPERLQAKYQQMAELLAPFAAKEGKQTELEVAVQDLTARTYERAKAASDFLAAQ